MTPVDVVVLRPFSLVVGVGAAKGAPVGEVLGLIEKTLAHAGLSFGSLTELATLDAKAGEPGIVAAAERLGVPLVTHSAAELAAVDVPNPSGASLAATGTPSVAEAAALVRGGELLVPKRKSARADGRPAQATCAVVRRPARGRLAVVGLGPRAGDPLTPPARAELARASVLVGLDRHVDRMRALLPPGTRILESGFGAEEERARTAVAEARKGQAVVLIGSGDAGVYAMASPTLADTAALAAATTLGAPFGHGPVSISLSGPHTPRAPGADDAGRCRTERLAAGRGEPADDPGLARPGDGRHDDRRDRGRPCSCSCQPPCSVLRGEFVTTPPPALLIAGHGTRDDAEAEAFRDVVRELGRRHPELPVAGGFVELSPPLGEAVTELVERGVRRFAAVPLTLVSAGPSKGDVPAALARERERHPGISYTCGRPLGPHPALLGVLERRLDEALRGGGRSPGGRAEVTGRSPGDRADVTVLLVGRGSTSPDANAEVHKAARLLWEGRGYAGVEPAFVSSAAPDVPSGLDRCVKLGARRIGVLPYFLFPGVLPDRIRDQAEGWAAAHPEVEVRSAGVIGPEPELLDLVMERYREAQAGDPCVPCDACVHHVAPPGFEEKAGLPHLPRLHPDDDGHHHDRHHDRHHHHHHGGHAHSHAH